MLSKCPSLVKLNNQQQSISYILYETVFSHNKIINYSNYSFRWPFRTVLSPFSSLDFPDNDQVTIMIRNGTFPY